MAAYGPPRADIVLGNKRATRKSRDLSLYLLFVNWGHVMVAFNGVRCTVIAVPVSENFCLSRGALAREVLPWADPYVAQLIKNLQDEVREEREVQNRVRHYRPTVGELT